MADGVAVVPSSLPVRPHLSYLDGLRGLAAPYVILYHIFDSATQITGKPLSPALFHFFGWLYHGHLAVAVFIVLSGYCLMLPVAQSKDGRLRGEMREFVGRRAKRILPK